MSTIEDFVATWSSDLASPPVVLAPNTHGRDTRSTWIRESRIMIFVWIETDLSIDYDHKMETDENP